METSLRIYLNDSPIFIFAHNPFFASIPPVSAETAIKILDPSISRVFYSLVNPLAPYTWFVFNARKGDSISLSVGVPYIERLRGLVPIALLIGPGLPASDLPFGIPDGYGSIVLENSLPPVYFHEEFTDTKSWIYVDRKVEIRISGTYYFVAYPSDPTPGNNKLWMAIGTRERFSLMDILSFLKIRKYVRNFHETGQASA